MNERKIIVEIATSADGYIARKNGSVDWLDFPSPPGNYGMDEFVKSIDTILWGRKTYDVAVAMGTPDGGFGPGMKNYVFSRSPNLSDVPEVEFVQEDVSAFSRRLRETPGKNIWMMGGAALIGSFLDAGEIDEFSVHVIPVLIGEGIPLIEPGNRNVKLELISTQPFPDGVVHLHYRVPRLTGR